MNREGNSGEESLVDHLTELRIRLIRAVLAISATSMLCWIYSEKIFDLIRKPISPFLPQGLIFTAPMDKFMAHLKVSIFGGFILSTPVWLYQLWKFVAPGLYVHEKKWALSFIFSGSVLFLFGVGFAYFFVYPLAFEYLLNFGGQIDQPMISISEYLSFFLTTAIAFGITFELPLILTVLGIVGVIDRAFLVNKRRYAVVLMAVAAAVMTPTPDILSMVLMLIPLVALYEISIILVGILGTKTN